MKKLERTDNNIMRIALSFFGACENLLVLEDYFIKIGILTYPQYVNYLSQIALCIELGMKSILLNEGDIPKTHDIKELYALMPPSFRDMFLNNPFPKKTIEKSLEKIRNIFEEFRYMKTENLDFFLDKSILTKDNKIILSQLQRLQNFNFIIILLDKIKDFYKFLNNCIDTNNIFKNVTKNKVSYKTENTDLLNAISKYTVELKRIQPQLVYE